MSPRAGRHYEHKLGLGTGLGDLHEGNALECVAGNRLGTLAMGRAVKTADDELPVRVGFAPVTRYLAITFRYASAEGFFKGCVRREAGRRRRDIIDSLPSLSVSGVPSDTTMICARQKKT